MSIERDAKRIGSILGRALFGNADDHAELGRELAADAEREGLLRREAPPAPARGPGVAKARVACAACRDSGRIVVAGVASPCECAAGEAERDRTAIVVRGEPKGDR